VTVLYKLRDKYVFEVGWGLRLYNIIFQAIDSVCTTCNTANEVTNTCTNSGSALGASCAYVRNPTEICPGGETGSFIRFHVTSDTYRNNYQHVWIDNCEFHDYLYEMKSFIELNPFGAHISIKNSDFSQFSFCGSLITNDAYYVQRRTDLATSNIENNWHRRSNNYQADLFEEHVYDGWSGMNWGGCNKGSTHTSDLCFDLYVEGSTFTYFGAHKDSLDGPLWVDPDLNQQFLGTVFDLRAFRGNIAFVNNEFEYNKVKYLTCDTASDIMNGVDNRSGTDDPYPHYGTTKDEIQIKSVISVTDHYHAFYMTGNTFNRNTGTKGVVYLDLQDRKTYPLVISGNTFTNNGGYVDASVLHIRVRAESG